MSEHKQGAKGFGLPEASDENTHVRQNALEYALRDVIQAAQEVIANAHYDLRYGTGDLNDAMNRGIALLAKTPSVQAGNEGIERTGVSSNHPPDCWCPDCELDRANQPWKAPSPSLSPPVRGEKWTTEKREHEIGSWIVDGHGTTIAYSQFDTAIKAICDAHNATLAVRREQTSLEKEADVSADVAPKQKARI